MCANVCVSLFPYTIVFFLLSGGHLAALLLPSPRVPPPNHSAPSYVCVCALSLFLSLGTPCNCIYVLFPIRTPNYQLKY